MAARPGAHPVPAGWTDDLPRPWRADAREVMVIPVVCPDDHVSIQQARGQGREALYRIVGDRRRSDVWWLTVYGWKKVRDHLTAMYPATENTPEMQADLDEMLERADRYPNRCLLLLANCWMA